MQRQKSLYEVVDGFEDPEDRQIASGFVSGRISAIEAEERAQRNIEKANALRMQQAQMGQLNMQAQIEAIMNGQTQDAMGNGIATSAAQFKLLGFSEDQMILAVDNAFNSLDFDNPESMSKLMRLAYHPAFHNAFSRATNLNAVAGINSLTVNGEMSPMLQKVVDLYKRSPELTNSLISEDTTKASIACIANEGVDRFMGVRNILSNSEQLKQVDSDLEPYINDSLAGASLPALAGGDIYEGFSYASPNSGDLRDLFKSHARVFRALGMSPDEACLEARYKIASEFYVFGGAPIPKSAVNLVNIGGTSPEDSRATFHWVLGSKLKEYCGGTVDPNDVSISYVAGNANGSAMITFMSPNGYRQISLSDIISEAKADLTQAGNTTYDPPAGEATTMYQHKQKRLTPISTGHMQK